MSYTLPFASRYEFDTALQGINVPITLGSGAKIAQLQAKVDSGADGCILRAHMARGSALTLKAVSRRASAQPWVAFRRTVTKSP